MTDVAAVSLQGFAPRAVTAPRWPGRHTGLLRTFAGVAAALVAFALFLVAKGANPFSAYANMFTSTFTDWTSWSDIAIRACPLILAALAVCVPARAGLVNVGGEGQLLMGGLSAMGMALALDGRLMAGPTLVLMGLAAAIGGAVLAGIAVGLRLWVGINEAVSTLLLNYIALNVQRFLIFDRWKDRKGSGQPATRALRASERLPLIGTGRLHAGIIISVVAVAIVALLFTRSRWGFRLRVVGGNPEAARRAGMSVGRLLAGSMLVGGGLAGLGGFAQLAGAEFTLRMGFVASFGYVAFLASWLGRHRPVAVAFSATLLAALAVAGDSLQIDSRLPAASVNVLMALLLLGAFGLSRKQVAR